MYVKFPVDYVGITSNFGMRTHPITKVNTFHYGLDLGWNKYQGEPVYAPYNAVVVAEGYNQSMGNYLVIKYTKGNNVIINRYMHLKKRALVKKGKSIKQDDIVGYMGQTGLATGVHLHFEYWVCPMGYKYNASDVAKYAKNPLLYCYLFDDQTAGKNSINKLKKVVGITTQKNNNKDQIQVLKEYLNCRNNPGTTNTVLGYANIGYYNILDTKKINDTKWYKIDYNKWIALVNNYSKEYLIEKQIKNEETKKQKENNLVDKLVLENYKSYKCKKNGYYYIKLKEEEIIYFPK